MCSIEIQDTCITILTGGNIDTSIYCRLKIGCVLKFVICTSTFHFNDLQFLSPYFLPGSLLNAFNGSFFMEQIQNSLFT